MKKNKKRTKVATSPTVPTWIGDLELVTKELNLGTRRIHQLVKEGLPKADRGVYDVIECFRFYVRYMQAKLRERAIVEDGDGGGPATSSAGVRHKMLSIEVQLKQLDLAEKRGKMISIEKVEKDMAALVTEVRTRILALPPRLAAEVLGETDLAISQVKIDRSLKGALESLSEYDPDDKPELVRS